MRISLIVLAVFLAFSPPVAAGSKGKLAGFFAEYDDVKARVSDLLGEIDQARKDGYSSNPREILDLLKEVVQDHNEVSEYYYGQAKYLKKGGVVPSDQRALLALLESYNAMQGALSAENTYQMVTKSQFLLLVRAKYEDLYRLADEEISAARTANTTP